MVRPNVNHPDGIKLGKLPLWARDYIDALKRETIFVEKRNEELERERIAEQNTENTGRIAWEVGLDGEHTLPDRARVKLNPTDNPYKWIDARLRAVGDDDLVVEVTGSTAFSIEPRSANSVWFRLVR